MDNNIILAVIVGLIVGAFLTYIIKSKSKKNIDGVNNNIDASIVDNLNNTIKNLENEKESLVVSLSEYEKLKIEKVQLTAKLVENEKLLINLQSSINGDNPKKEFSEKLLKEIKQLKSEIDDLKDDLEDNKKRIEKLKAENNQIEEQFSIRERENKILIDEKENLTTEVKVLTHKNEETNNSLNFINNILNATNAYNQDFEKLDHDIWNIYYFIKNEISIYFEQSNAIEELAWQWRNSEIKTWIKGKKVVSIVGEFSAGKTSIVNRILSQDNPNVQLLPVSSKETTAIPTYISNGKDFNCQFFSPDNELRNISKETFEMVTKSVLDKVNVSHLIKYFVLSYENENLKNISILDTPGFGSNSEDVIKRTTDVVKESDAIFWVIDANTGDINQTSLEVMKNHLKDMPLYFILNKSDTKSENDLNKLEQKIRETASKNDINFIDVIRFSQKENVSVLLNVINGVEQKDQFNLLKHIDDILVELIGNLKKQKQEINEARKMNLKELTQTESNFRAIERYVVDSANKIKTLVKEKETWLGLGDNKYQIEKHDYNEFQESVSTIVNLSGKINEEVKFHSDDINTKIKIEADFEENKYQFKKIEEIQKEFIKLVKDYNPNILK